MFVVNSFLSGIRMGKRSTKGGARRASLFISSESGPNPAEASNSDRFPGIGEKVMQERSEMRFRHHFLRDRRGDCEYSCAVKPPFRDAGYRRSERVRKSL